MPRERHLFTLFVGCLDSKEGLFGGVILACLDPQGALSAWVLDLEEHRLFSLFVGCLNPERIVYFGILDPWR